MSHAKQLLMRIVMMAVALAVSGCVVMVNPPPASTMETQQAKLLKEMTATHRTEHLDLFARPGTQSARHQRRIARGVLPNYRSR